MREFGSIEELARSVGTEFGPGPWLPVHQDRIDLFAEATGDDQWIHIDPQRAALSPFGGTIAHGYLTLSLIPVLMRDLYRLRGVRMRINYGLNAVRFPSPVPVGSSLRARAQVVELTSVPGGYQLVLRITVESDASDTPACIAETVSRLYPEQVTDLPEAAEEAGSAHGQEPARGTG